MIASTCWQGAGRAKDLSRRLFPADLLGLDEHILAAPLGLGPLSAEVWTDCPVSRHSGAETCLVLAGVAEWGAGTQGSGSEGPANWSTTRPGNATDA